MWQSCELTLSWGYNYLIWEIQERKHYILIDQYLAGVAFFLRMVFLQTLNYIILITLRMNLHLSAPAAKKL